MRKLAVVELSLVLFVLPGCYSLGNQQISNPTIIAKIVPGETTKDEVVELIGKPTTVDFDEQEREKWLYSYTITKVSGRQLIPIFGMFAGPDIETHSLTVLFGDDDLVRKVAGGEAASKDTLQGAGLRERTKQTDDGSREFSRTSVMEGDVGSSDHD